ncbi:Type cbb3 cytochrome oxidase biogenesis protein CcoH [hydrothermal vent metagenome]|uniref:Type cbb3 cytochrome oxidase biogenesis protein CcoH n=1 Tax=hydrothermal vent metagenome TaxID=652676 RepID=A0A1W1C6C3_9ZZZZ
MPFYKSPLIVFSISLFFILVFATFYRIYISFETNPGLVIDNPQKKGESYAKTLANNKKIKKMGWRLKLIFPKSPEYNTKHTYKVFVESKKNVFNNPKVQLYFYRPADPTSDFSVPMIGSNQHFSATVSIPLKGLWEVVAEFTQDDIVLQKGKRVFFKD